MKKNNLNDLIGKSVNQQINKPTEAVSLTYEIQTYSCSVLTNVSTMRGDGVTLELLPYYKVDGYAPLPKN